MRPEDYHKERVKLQMFQARIQLVQVAIQAVTLLATLILLGNKL
jgi:hypothetical protein